MLRVTRNIQIPEQELDERFVRASGPGGQNVNKVSTAVQLRFDAKQSPFLPEDVRERLLTLAKSRLVDDGGILIEAKRYRTQERNRRDARERLLKLIRRAVTAPKKRKRTRPSQASNLKRLEDKRRRSEKKQTRGRLGWGR